MRRLPIHRFRLALSIILIMASGAIAWDGPGLLQRPKTIDAMRSKVEQHAWAKQIADDLVNEATAAITQPVAPPTTGGGWTHNYVCPKCAGKLTFRKDHPHDHLCSKCNGTYRHKDMDDAWVTIVHRQYGDRALRCGLAYALTGKETFADCTVRILTWYADHYADFPVHGRWAGKGRVTGQSLGEATWLIDVVQAFDLIAPTLDEAGQQHIIDNLFIPAAKHIEAHGITAKVHNIECWQASARLMAAVVADNAVIRDRAVESLKRNIAEGISDEGFWFEGSPGYHLYTLRALTPALLVARHRNIDLGPTERILGMYTVLSKLTMAGDLIPALNDSWIKGLGSLATYLEVGSYLFDEPELPKLLSFIYDKQLSHRASLEALQWGPTGLPKHPVIHPAGTRMDDIGLAVVRAGGMTAVLKAGANHGGHDHPDRLNLVLADENHMWVPDLGSPSYGHPLHRKWYRTTLAHNTLEVDSKSQKTKLKGKVSCFHESADWAAATVQCDNLYPGVGAWRTVVLTDGLAFDVVQATSETSHDYRLSARGSGTMTIPDTVDGPYRKDKEFLNWLNTETGNEVFTTAWHHEGHHLNATFGVIAPQSNTVAFDVIDAPGFAGQSPMRQVVSRCQGTEVLFWTVYRSDAADRVESKVIKNPDHIDLMVTGPDTKYVIRVNGRGTSVEKLSNGSPSS